MSICCFLIHSVTVIESNTFAMLCFQFLCLIFWNHLTGLPVIKQSRVPLFLSSIEHVSADL